MLFPLHWTMPVHREPLWIEIKFDNFLTWLTELFSAPFRGTVLEWWLLQPEGQTFTQTFTIILALSIWCFALDGTLWRTMRAFRAKLNHIHITDGDTDVMGSIGDTPIMRKLAPPGQRPTNARLGGSPFRVGYPLGGRTGHFSSPDQTALFGVEKEEAPGRGRPTSRSEGLGGRTGRPWTSDYQTPFKTFDSIETFDQNSGLSTRESLSRKFGTHPEVFRAIGTPASQGPTVKQSSPGFTTFMSEMEKLKEHVDSTIADLDNATSSPNKLGSDSAMAIDRSKTAKKKTLREHCYPQSVEHPDKFPSSVHFSVPSDEEWGDEEVDF